jgi:hypothetical protein
LDHRPHDRLAIRLFFCVRFRVCEIPSPILRIAGVDVAAGLGLNGDAGVQEAVLDNYEIRIVKKSKAVFIYASPQASDYAAVRRAQSLVEEGDEVEVWRDLDCVYSTREEQPYIRRQ